MKNPDFFFFLRERVFLCMNCLFNVLLQHLNQIQVSILTQPLKNCFISFGTPFEVDFYALGHYSFT